jgi:hypothetical protein
MGACAKRGRRNTSGKYYNRVTRSLEEQVTSERGLSCARNMLFVVDAFLHDVNFISFLWFQKLSVRSASAVHPLKGNAQ